MKPQSVDNFILFNIFGRKNKTSKQLISAGICCKQGKGVLNCEMDNVEVRAVINYFCKKGMSPKTSFKPLGMSPSYSILKK